MCNEKRNHGNSWLAAVVAGLALALAFLLYHRNTKGTGR
jgi:formate/nitrite transporter FocA (FNT family)